MSGIDEQFIREATAVDDARNAARAALRAANLRGSKGSDTVAIELAMSVVKDRAEALRRRYFPLRHSLVIADGVAIIVSATGRRQVVWRRDVPDGGAA